MSKTNCRFCGKSLSHVFADLGLSPLSNEYIAKEDLNKGQYFYPLKVNVCDACFMVQAMEFSKPEDIFSEYKYFSSYSKSWLKHCKEYVDMIIPLLSLDKNSSVVEIACNDGYLLQYFQQYHIPVYGIEPAENVASEACKKGIDVISEFFNDKLAASLLEKHNRADLIIGNNVLAHVPDINGFVEGLRVLLSSKGSITMEFPHLLNLMRFDQFDTIYHEHYSYFSLIAVRRIFEAHKLKITKAEELDTHGGSLRIYATHIDNDVIIDDSVRQILESEKNYGLDNIKTYTDFNNRIMKIKRDSIRVLSDIKDQGKQIAAFGAAAKGNTFLNYCGIGRDFIDYVVDSSRHKQGLYLPGTLIPIVGKDEILKRRPDYIIILPWNLSAEIEEEVKAARKWGCKLITFIPEARIY